MNNKTRRDFFKIAGAGIAGSALLSLNAPLLAKSKNIPFQIGMASYTFRKFNLEDTLAMTKRLGIKEIAFKSFHLPLDSSENKIMSVIARVKTAGLDLYGGGVIYMKNENDVNQAFDYAKMAGMRIIIGVPEHNLLPMVEKKAKEYNIKVAIHNHGPNDKRYPTPGSVYKLIKNLDKHIGLCMDIGHTMRAGVDPADAAKKYRDRLYDIHVKDVTKATAAGKTIEVGRGVIDIPKFLRTLIKINYKGNASLEFEKDPNDPLPGAAESVGYLRGVLAVI